MQWEETWYAQDVPADAKSDTARLWTGLLQRHQPDLKKRVELAVKRWNFTVRDLVRNETGLRLSTDSDATQVPLKVVDGLPIPLAGFLREYDPIAELLLYRHSIEGAYQGLEIVHRLYERWRAFSPGGALPDDQIAATRNWMGDISNHLDGEQIDDGLRQYINEDCLGAYFFNAPRIEIYWVAIGILAQITGATVEGLTVITLAHELAHAYTHRGKDIDGKAWETQAFAEADLHITEGLAQFYARAVSKKLDERFPAALLAFEALLKAQSPTYTDFLHWLPGCPQPGEVVRFSMIHTRTNFIRDYGQFRNQMEQLRV